MIYSDTKNINDHAQKILTTEDFSFDREGSTLYWSSKEIQITLTESDFFNVIADDLRDWLGEFYFEGGEDTESSYYTGCYN